MCGDDSAWKAMHSPKDHWLYGFGESSDFQVTALELTDKGMSLEVGTPFGIVHLRSPMIGRHNALNLVAALGVGVCLGVDVHEMANALGQVQGVPGRLESVPNRKGILVLVDYAHTPDALKSVLETVGEVTQGQVWVVFGCGGDRDRGKRAEMGRVAVQYGDQVVVTSDNPRNESPATIIDDILKGTPQQDVHVVAERGKAIRFAIGRATRGDVILIAGKGHETYQEIEGKREPFDDRLVALSALEESGSWTPQRWQWPREDSWFRGGLQGPYAPTLEQSVLATGSWHSWERGSMDILSFNKQ